MQKNLKRELNQYRDCDAITEEEGDLLYGLVRSLKPRICVETGTHKGYSTLRIAEALSHNECGKIYTCDISDWGAKGNFRNEPELEKHIVFRDIPGTNLKIDEKIDFLFIDSAHEFENVSSEIKHFFPMLSEEAVVVFHDCAGDGKEVGVNEAVEKFGLNAVFIPTHNVMRIYCRKGNYNLSSGEVQKRKDEINAREN